MDLRRLRAGEWVAAVSGLVLLVSLFLPWYDDGEGSGSQTGWEAFALLDLLLAVVALAALAIPLVTASQRVPAVSIAHQSLTTLVGILTLVWVLIRVLNLPDEATGREIGLAVGCLATLGVVAGGLIAMRDERLSPPDGHTDLTGVPVDHPREIEALPAPRPEASP